MVDLYGIAGANGVLRKFGVNRLLFATDYPFYDYERYYGILNQMDFDEEEARRIAYGNASGLFGI